MNVELKEVTDIPVFENKKHYKKIMNSLRNYLIELKNDFDVAMDEIVTDGIIKHYGLIKENESKK